MLSKGFNEYLKRVTGISGGFSWCRGSFRSICRALLGFQGRLKIFLKSSGGCRIVIKAFRENSGTFDSISGCFKGILGAFQMVSGAFQRCSVGFNGHFHGFDENSTIILDGKRRVLLVLLLMHLSFDPAVHIREKIIFKTLNTWSLDTNWLHGHPLRKLKVWERLTRHYTTLNNGPPWPISRLTIQNSIRTSTWWLWKTVSAVPMNRSRSCDDTWSPRRE